MADAATPGEWEIKSHGSAGLAITTGKYERVFTVARIFEWGNAAFIVAARAAVPALLADVDALTAEVARLMEAGRDMQEQRDGWRQECEQARLERSFWCTQAQDEHSRREFVAQERDALAAELERVRGELAAQDTRLFMYKSITNYEYEPEVFRPTQPQA